jgi:AraC family transcriptional regulator
MAETFECNVLGCIETPLATIELHDYQFHGGQSAEFEPRFGFLDLALSPRPGTPRGRYLNEPGFAMHAMGDVIFIPAGRRLCSQWGGGAQRSICLQFEGQDSDGRDGWTASELEASLDVRSPFARDGLLRLAHEIEWPGFESKLMAEAICVQLGIDLGRYFRTARSTGEILNQRLSPAQLRWIEERLDAPGPSPCVAELATACGLSTRHFFRMFRMTTGVTLSEFTSVRRIARARSLLAEGRLSIKQVSWQCGFATAAAFSAAFRRATGFQPKEYRQLMMR